MQLHYLGCHPISEARIVATSPFHESITCPFTIRPFPPISRSSPASLACLPRPKPIARPGKSSRGCC
ncbi:hypothetical protein BRAS3843_570038 [Bradyrhizobium sp. STM 3843]|nr:hypothetical protein BRAS3843_570038 [Bradyrhizobium sp. STM 3843]